jgi:acetoin:2,6-dichlorophenolindophenol oxidoreductase subunit beta
MSKKPYAYAFLEGLANEMKANPKICYHVGQGSYTATSSTGEILNINAMFPFPRTTTRGTSPIDETSYAGWANGIAAAGMVAVTRFPSMANLIAAEHIYNNAAKLHYMTGGHVDQAIVFIMDGAYRQPGQAGQHTEVGQEAIYAFYPGLKVVCPSTGYDAKGLLVSALREGTPVMIWQYTLVQTGEEEIPDENYTVPIGKAKVVQEGKDITLVAWAPTTVEVLKALPALKTAGISVEYIDPRTIKPFDTATLVASVKKTGRLLVVEQGPYTNSFSSHVIAEAAQIVRGAIYKKITFPDAPGPGAPEMITWMTPDAPKIIDAVKQMVATPI